MIIKDMYFDTETDITDIVLACVEGESNVDRPTTKLCEMIQFLLELLPEDKQINFINKFSYRYKAE